MVKIDINCHIQGDVVLECITIKNDLQFEDVLFRIMFNTAFIQSNILILNHDEIDTPWNVQHHFSRDFRAEVNIVVSSSFRCLTVLQHSCTLIGIFLLFINEGPFLGDGFFSYTYST